MPSTYTTNGAIQKPANGEQDGTWGDVINANMDILDRVTNGVGAITLSGTTYTLTVTNGVASPGHYKVLLLGGSPAAPVTITVSPSTAQRLYFVKNNCGQNVTFTQGSGSTVTLGSGQAKIVYCDGGGATANVSATLSNDLVMASGTILTSTINSSTIGATTPSTGAFTTLAASGATTLSDTLAVTGDVAVDTNTLFVDTTNNRVGVKTATPSVPLDVVGAIKGSGNLTIGTTVFKVDQSAARVGVNTASPTVALDVAGELAVSGNVAVDTNTLFVDTTNNMVGIGTSSPAATLHIVDGNDSGAQTSLQITSTGAGSGLSPVMRLYRNSASPAALDLAGAVQFTGNNASGTAVGYGMMYAAIGSTTAGAENGSVTIQTMQSGTLTDALSLTSLGTALIGKGASTFSVAGVALFKDGHADLVRDGAVPLAINRLTDDGNLVQFYQDSTLEGGISVSGTTVSYNGGHLSRWAQLADGSRPALLKGTVMTNKDAMAVWPGEDNEQLNCVAVSTVAGDRNVAGLFVAWEDAGATNDLRLAMTGDMVVRIAPGAVVSRGDLLVSNGDGCAVAQSDDVVRAATVAKVTSTHVSATYPDGSYCVPCVVMAC